MTDLVLALIKNKPEEVSAGIIFSFAEDMMKYFENEEAEEHKTNQ